MRVWMRVWPYVVTWMVGSILIIVIVLTSAANGKGPVPPPIDRHEMCTLALMSDMETVPVCEGPDGWVLLDYVSRYTITKDWDEVGDVCDKECQRICLGRELGNRD